mmetsp:Transcript_9574/g.21744  ORF Transcript_9574/g.21744 Transcript_9574/m.21744 type:complete len:131 (+) Transcript_9574:114-506(+)
MPPPLFSSCSYLLVPSRLCSSLHFTSPVSPLKPPRRSYWLFSSKDSRVFVYDPSTSPASSTEEATDARPAEPAVSEFWGYYDRADQIDSLLAYLNPHGLCWLSARSFSSHILRGQGSERASCTSNSPTAT